MATNHSICCDCGGPRHLLSGKRCKSCWDIKVASKPLILCLMCKKRLRHPANLCRDCFRAKALARRHRISMSARPTATIRTCVIHVLRLKREAMLKTLRVKVNDRQLRENFRSPIPLDKHSFFHEHIPDLNCRDPLHELMAKEEAEEAQKWKHITEIFTKRSPAWSDSKTY
jgi:hypothetical protein